MAHVFVSFVQEDRERVKRLAAELRRHGVEPWIHDEKIVSGERWKAVTRKAIEEGTRFIACFSRSYLERDSTYMNEELTVAVGELRQRHRDRAWFIPLVFDGSPVPDWDLGGGESLHDLQWLDFSDWDRGMPLLLHPLGRPAPETATPAGSPPRGSGRRKRTAIIAALCAIPLVLLLAYLGRRASPGPRPQPAGPSGPARDLPRPVPYHDLAPAGPKAKQDERTASPQEGNREPVVPETKRREPAAKPAEKGDQPDQGLATGNLVFPSVVEAVYRGDFDAVPDDQVFRSYIVSLFKGFADSCGVASSSESLAAARYGLPQMRKNPYDLLGEYLLRLAKARDSGSVANLGALNESPILREGVEDAVALAARYRCNSWEIRQLRQRIGELVEARQTAEPASLDRERVLAQVHPKYREIVRGSVSALMPQSARRETLDRACRKDNTMTETYLKRFCTCVVDAIFETAVSPSLQDAFVEDFDKGLNLAEAQNPRFAEQWQHCRQ